MFKLLFIVASVVCMVKAMPTPEETNKSQNTNSSKPVRYCQPQTPCGWKINTYVDYPEIEIANEYCTCSAGQKCEPQENRVHEGYVEYRCKDESR